MISARDALQRLRDGNRRFVDSLGSPSTAPRGRRHALLADQSPYATILGCSDSRVAPEIVFDAGLGELFVIRVAGNIATPVEIGSIEYAAAKLGTPLVLVLGHSRCGAVGATLDELDDPGSTPTPNLRALVECILPAVRPLARTSHTGDRAVRYDAAVRANVVASMKHLTDASSLLRELAARDAVQIVGAVYSLETGQVELLSETPA